MVTKHVSVFLEIIIFNLLFSHNKEKKLKYPTIIFKIMIVDLLHVRNFLPWLVIRGISVSLRAGDNLCST